MTSRSSQPQDPQPAHDARPAPDSQAPSPAAFALATEIVSLERHVAAAGWDAPIRVFALVHTAQALVDTPSLAEEIPPEALAQAEQDPAALLAIEQEGLPQAPNLEALLAQLAWPETVHGVAIAVEQFVVPPEAEEGLGGDAQAKVDALLAHPDRDDVRIVVGVLRSGESWCALRYRSHDADDQVAQSSAAVPGLIEALQATLV